MNCTPQEERLLLALESMLAFTEPDSQQDMQTDVRLREEFQAVRESAELTAEHARDAFTGKVVTHAR